MSMGTPKIRMAMMSKKRSEIAVSMLALLIK
jgi:hypothetical protein